MKNLYKEWLLFKQHPALYFDRSFSSGTGKQMGWLLLVFIIVLIFLYAIYCMLPGEGGLVEKFSNLLFQLIDPSDTDKMPVLFAVIVDVLGLIIFGGMLISVASNILERRVEAFQNGETTYGMNDHILIIGYNSSVPSLVKTLRTTQGAKRDEELFIVIQSEQATSDIRNRLHISSEEWMEKNTLVVHGQCNSREDLEKLHVVKCCRVYIIGDDTLEAHDSTNMECLSLIAALWCEEYADKEGLVQNKLHCHVLFDYQTVYSVFQFSELRKKVSSAIHFHPFNLHENWAKKILVVGESGEGEQVITYKPLEGCKGLQKDSKKHVHLIIVGMSRMGTALAVEAAQTAHYFNFREDDDTTRTHITFIDCNAEEEKDMFMSRFPNVFDMMRWRYIDAQEEKGQLYTLCGKTWNNPIENADSPYKHLRPNFTDLQWEFINGRVESPAVRRYMIEAIMDMSAITTIAVCLPESQQATQAALYLPDIVHRNAHQILVYQQVSDAVVRNVNNPDDVCDKYDRMLTFGLLSDSYSNDKIGDYEGKWINAYYEKEYGTDKDKESWIEKDEHWADEKWDNTSVSNKWSSIHSANMIYTKLRMIGCKKDDGLDTIRAAMIANMSDLITTEHNRWVAEQLLAGFRPLFENEWQEYHQQTKKRAKNAVAKAHGNICSNATLKQEEPDSHKKDEQVTLALLEIIEHKRALQK